MKCLVVSGKAGAGKTTLSRLICEELGLHYTNVGELLRERLARDDVAVAGKERVGQAFLDRFGIDGYVRLISAYARRDALLDGVRLAVGVEASRKTTPTTVLFRLGPPELTTRQPWERDLIRIAESSEIVVDWQVNLTTLRAETHLIVDRIRKIS